MDNAVCENKNCDTEKTNKEKNSTIKNKELETIFSLKTPKRLVIIRGQIHINIQLL